VIRDAVDEEDQLNTHHASLFEHPY